MEQLLIPVRRGDTILVFERRRLEAGRRAEFLAIAEVSPDGAVAATGMRDLAEDEAETVAKVAAKLPALERFTAQMSVHDLPSIQTSLDAPAEAGIVDNSVLMTLTLYLDFCRQTLVQEAAVRRYESRPPEGRLDIGLTASIYESLLRSHELARAEALIDSDLKELPPALTRHPEAGYLLGLAATVKQRLGRAEGALVLMETVSRLRPDHKLLVRMAHLYRAQNDTEKAIRTLRRAEKIQPLGYKSLIMLGHLLARQESYDKACEALLKAEEQKPLQHGAARYLAWWMFHAGDLDRAEIWAQRAEARGSTTMENLYQRVNERRGEQDLP